MKSEAISLPLLFFQEPPSDKPASPSQRNVSNPYGLTVPPRSHRRLRDERADTPTQYLQPPNDVKGKMKVGYLEIPKCPKRAVIGTDKPIRPRPYTLNGQFTSSTSFQLDSPYMQRSTGKPKPKPKPKINDQVLAIAVTIALAVLLAIGIPLGVILPQRYIKPLPINVLVPFFVNPENGGWKHLEEAYVSLLLDRCTQSNLPHSIIKHHDINFTVVVNPNDGPGNRTWPSASYIDVLKIINIYPNVQTLGYINTANGTIANATVRAQIATYAGWKKVSAGMALRGIYFDHTPWQNDHHGIAEAYLRNVSAAVKHTDGWNGGGEGVVVHNPGHIPDAGLMVDQPDITVVYEGTYDDMPERKTLHEELAAVEGKRENFAMLAHSVPKDLGRGGLRKIIERVRRDVEWLHLTDLTDDVYAGYGSIWEEWLDIAW